MRTTHFVNGGKLKETDEIQVRMRTKKAKVECQLSMEIGCSKHLVLHSRTLQWQTLCLGSRDM